MKKVLSLLLSAVLLPSLCACGASADTSADPTEAPAAAATTLQVVVAALVVHADESLSDVNLTSFLKVNKRKKMLADICDVGLAVHVQAHEVESIEQLYIKA